MACGFVRFRRTLCFAASVVYWLRYDKLFSALDFELPRAKTGRTGFPKDALLCAFIVMKCEGFVHITDLLDYLENNLLIAYYCGLDITKAAAVLLDA